VRATLSDLFPEPADRTGAQPALHYPEAGRDSYLPEYA
jgi:hypothetical protein